jgi:hypothetical protein
MRQNLLLILFSCLSSIIWGQVPQGIPYQAVARDAQGNPMANQSLTVQFSLHEASTDGQVVYQETQTSSTNAQGLFSLTFGAGVPSVGTFGSINWGSGYKFLQVQANFGNGYVDLGTQQLMSVPYALYSGSSGNNSSGVADNTKLGKGFSMISNLSVSNYSLWDAVNYCSNLEEGGFSDWRIPNYEEVLDYLSIYGFSLSTQYYIRTITEVSRETYPNVCLSIVKPVNSSDIGIGQTNSNALTKCNCVR